MTHDEYYKKLGIAKPVDEKPKGRPQDIKPNVGGGVVTPKEDAKQPVGVPSKPKGIE